MGRDTRTGGGEVCLIVCLSLLKVTALRRGQHGMYVYVFVCYETITPNSGVKSDKHFHIELFTQQRKNVHQPWPLSA